MKKLFVLFPFLSILLPMACTQTTRFPTVPGFVPGQTTSLYTPTPTVPTTPGTGTPTPIPGGGYSLQWGSYGAAVSQFYFVGPYLPFPPYYYYGQLPNLLAVGSSKVFVQDFLDPFNYGVKVFDLNGIYVNQWAFPAGVTLGGNAYTMGTNAMASDAANNLYVLGLLQGNPPVYPSFGYAIAKYNSNGTPLAIVGLDSDDQVTGSFSGIAVGSSGNVFLSGAQNPIIPTPTPYPSAPPVYFVEELNSSFAPVTTWGVQGGAPGQMFSPAAIGVDSSDNVYTIDIASPRVQKFTANGFYLGQIGVVGSGYGQVMSPQWITLDGSNNIYMVDTQGGTLGATQIKKFNSTGTFISQFGSYGAGPGQFQNVGGFAVDSGGDVFIADSSNYRLEKFHP